MAEATAPDPLLLAEGAPDRLRTLLESSMRTCMSAPGSKEPRCRAQALLAAYNAGWAHADTGWLEGSPRATTFAEKVDALGSPASFYMRDVKILEPGEWTNGATGEKVVLGEDDLRKIAADSNAILARFKPPLLPDHPQRGRYGPAFGWAGHFYAKPDGLYTQEVTDIPPSFASLLEGKQYKRLSAGLRRNYKEDATGKTFSMVVDHIAALGAAKPIIDTLPDLPEVLAASEMSGEVITLIPLDEKENEMPDAATEAKKAEEAKAKADAKDTHDQDASQEVKAALAELKAERAAREADRQALKDLREEMAQMRKERADEVKTRVRAGIESFVDSQVNEGRIIPANRDLEVETGITMSEAADMYQFAEGTETKQITKYDAWRLSVERRPRVIKFGESASQPVGKRPGSVSDLDDRKMRSLGSSAEEAGKIVEKLNEGKLGVTLGGALGELMNS